MIARAFHSSRVHVARSPLGASTAFAGMIGGGVPGAGASGGFGFVRAIVSLTDWTETFKAMEIDDGSKPWAYIASTAGARASVTGGAWGYS